MFLFIFTYLWAGSTEFQAQTFTLTSNIDEGNKFIYFAYPFDLSQVFLQVNKSAAPGCFVQGFHVVFYQQFIYIYIGPG